MEFCVADDAGQLLYYKLAASGCRGDLDNAQRLAIKFSNYPHEDSLVNCLQEA